MFLTKLCGMKTIEAARAAERAGADMIGFIFWKQARRYVAPELAREIAVQLARVKKVGVFVDEDISVVQKIAQLVPLDYVQLHGHETAEYAEEIGVPVIRAFRYTANLSADEVNAYPAEIALIDAYQTGVPGGTGETFDWRCAAEVLAKIKKPILIAGGISENNFRDAMEIFHPYGLDVSGSLEINGEKSIARIESFLSAVRTYMKEKKV